MYLYIIVHIFIFLFLESFKEYFVANFVYIDKA